MHKIFKALIMKLAMIVYRDYRARIIKKIISTENMIMLHTF